MGVETLGYAATGFSALGAVDKALGARNAAKDAKSVQRETDRRSEDTSFRQEATYRYKREMLQGAIEDFYKKKGWKLPEALPGAFTTRSLPGEVPLYPDYDIPRPDTYYQKLEPEMIEEEMAETPTPNTALPVDNTYLSEPLKVENAQSGYFGNPEQALVPVGANQLQTLQPRQPSALIEDEELRKLSSPYGYL